MRSERQVQFTAAWASCGTKPRRLSPVCGPRWSTPSDSSRANLTAPRCATRGWPRTRRSRHAVCLEQFVERTPTADGCAGMSVPVIVESTRRQFERAANRSPCVKEISPNAAKLSSREFLTLEIRRGGGCADFSLQEGKR